MFQSSTTPLVDITPSLEPSKAGGIDIAEMQVDMKSQDKLDKEEAKTMRKEKKRVSWTLIS